MSNYHVHERFNGIIEQSMNHILKTNEFLSIICKTLCGGARYQRAILPRLKVRASKVVNNYPGGHGGNKSMLRNKMTGTMAVDNTRCMYVRMYANCTSRLRHIYIYIYTTSYTGLDEPSPYILLISDVVGIRLA